MKTRSNQAAAKLSARTEGQGRPLGLLAAWLLKARDYATASDHKESFASITLEQRVSARAAFKREVVPTN